MGTYTTLNLNVKLKSDTPKIIIEFFTRLLNGGQLEFCEQIALTEGEFHHEFFVCERWYMLLTAVNGDDELSGGKIINHDGLYYRLVLETQFKNYNCELDKFLNWIKPYVRGSKKKTYLGWYKNETHKDRNYLHITKP